MAKKKSKRGAIKKPLLRTEPLEPRQLLAFGPQLVAVVPNVGDVLLNDDVLNSPPQQLTLIFNEGEAIAPSSLDGITIEGSDGTSIAPGYIAVDPDRPNQVILRFAEQLADDSYTLAISGGGDTFLTNLQGQPFDCGRNFELDFEIDRGAQIVAVVPQPITNVGGTLSQAGNVIEVYFNDDDLSTAGGGPSAENPEFYQLIKTQDSATNADDAVFIPTAVAYDPATDTARLTFASDISELGGGPGTFRLRIGTDESTPAAPIPLDPASATLTDFGTSGDVRVRFEASVDFSPALEIDIQSRDLGVGVGPGFDFGPNQLFITLNSNASNPTTADELVAALNGDEFFSARFATASVFSGNGATNIASVVAATPLAPFVTLGEGSTFRTASALGQLTSTSRLISATIDPQPFDLDLPGSDDNIGDRDLFFEPHLDGTADATAGITRISYNFRDNYAPGLLNAITETQKQRAREVFEIYGSVLGVTFYEADQTDLLRLLEAGEVTFTVATGDLAPLMGISGPGGTEGLADNIADPVLGDVPTIILDNAEQWDDATSGNYFETAMREIGRLLGLGLAFDLPDGTVLGGNGEAVAQGLTPEPVFPGDQDIVHGQYLHRPDSKDIDLYTFNVQESGLFSAEIIAERLPNSSLLDATLTLYRQNNDGSREVISRNDDYYSEDSFVELQLEAGVYFVAVAASGNDQFDPHVDDSGFGGTSQGEYQLRLNFRPDTDRAIVDTTGVALDGDGDGNPGGVFNYWFTAQSADRTLIVDKTAGGGGNGSLSNPYNSIPQAIAAATAGDVIRIVGNGGSDGDINTVGDNAAYEIGFNIFNQPLSDGTTLEVPQDVTLVADAGAIFKLSRARIGVGSAAPTVDQSGGSFQVLGTPNASVIFTSFNDQETGVDTNPLETIARPGDWGGIAFHNNLDRGEGRFSHEANGAFINYVSHADIRFGGGEVVVNSISQVVAPIDLDQARPTLIFNRITQSADAAIAADPNSFEETNFHAIDSFGIDYQSTPFTSDYDRIGPEIHGNVLLDNTINGLFIRISTPAGGESRTLSVAGRWDDTDIVHVVPENLVIEGTPGGPVASVFRSVEFAARTDARLAIDSGTIVKLDGARIEAEIGAQLIAEADALQPIIFTSLRDDRFGAGGTFSTNTEASDSLPSPGDWGGIYVGQEASASIDNARFSFGGGVTTIEGGFAGFNTIEIHRGDARISNSLFEQNADGVGGQAAADSARAGRGVNDAGVIYVRGAQPVIINNRIIDNVVRTDDNGGRNITTVPAISINVNSLNHFHVTDLGRSTGNLDALEEQLDNQGPLIRGNLTSAELGSGALNGVVVRGAFLTTESVWDDTDITHILDGEIVVENFHVYGGLRLESAADESLVVKALPDSGFTATGRALDIEDRIGGRIQVVGQPGFPVVITSINDDTVGAGFDLTGAAQNDTNSNGLNSQATPGDWRSILLDSLAHDRNVEVVIEPESELAASPGINATPQTAQVIGQLAPNEQGGDENLRLGFDVHGFLSDQGDVDVYSFVGTAGTQIRLDIDRTSHWLDTVLELIDSNGQVIAASDDSGTNSDPAKGLSGLALPTNSSDFSGSDAYTTNPRDAGFRVTLPGAPGSLQTYHVRVRMSDVDVNPGNRSEQLGGIYQLGIRLGDTDEISGTTIQFADIRFAETGIDVNGLTLNSPLTGEHSESLSDNDSFGTAQDLGNVLSSNLGAIGLSGSLSAGNDVDWYSFDVNYDDVETPGTGPNASVVLDLDYADGLARPDVSLFLYNSGGELIYFSESGNVSEDLAAPFQGTDLDDLSRGSVSTGDPFLGPISLPVGTYFVAITGGTAEALSDDFVRLEPANVVNRIAEDHVGFTGGPPVTFNQPHEPILLGVDNIVPFNLGDLNLYVSSGTSTTAIDVVNPLTGAVKTRVGDFDISVGDIAIRRTGEIQSFTSDYDGSAGETDTDDTVGNYLEISTLDATTTIFEDDGIETFEEGVDEETGEPTEEAIRSNDDNGVGIHFEAITFTTTIQNEERLFGIGSRPASANMPEGVDFVENVLFRLDPNTGEVINSPATAGDREDGALIEDEQPGTNAIEVGTFITDAGGSTSDALIVTGATDGFEARISTGTTFVVAGTTFEFTAGPEVRVTHQPENGNFLRDGDSFAVASRFDTTLEFDTGTVLQVNAENGNDIVDGDTFTLTDNAAIPQTHTFEFNDISQVNPMVSQGNVAVLYRPGDARDTIIANIITAIDSAPTFALSAAGVVDGNRISLINESDVFPSSSTGVGVVTVGQPGLSDPDSTAIRIPIEESWDTTQIGNAIEAAAPSGIGANFQGGRLNFSGASVANFTEPQARGVFDVISIDDTIGDGNIPVQFDVDATGTEIAAAVSTALFNGGFDNQVNSTVVALNGAEFESADTPLTITGSAPGGRFTGVAEVNGSFFAVTDTGGVFELDFGGVTAAYLPASAAFTGIEFQGLTAGPENAEDGRYLDMLFAIDTDGVIYAIGSDGSPQPVFFDGTSSLETGISGADGLTFSTLDINLWHQTTNRGFDPGHGINATDDNTRVLPSPGGTSYWFGFEGQAENGLAIDPLKEPGQESFDTFAFPGGAHGALETESFSLEGYDAGDAPSLYFNYFLETEDKDWDPLLAARDSFRIFVMDSSDTGAGTWHLAATNNTTQGPPGPPMGLVAEEVNTDDLTDPAGSNLSFGLVNPISPIALEDNTGRWIQAEIDLSAFAGSDELRIRFDFNTAGTTGIGTESADGVLNYGNVIRHQAGNHFVDGTALDNDPDALPTFMINGETFEIDLGYVLAFGSGADIADGDTISIESPDGSLTFEFDFDGEIDPANAPILVNTLDSPAVIATAVQQAILDAGFAQTEAFVEGRRVNLSNTTSLSFNSSGITLDGEPGTDGIPVNLNWGMDNDAVRDALQEGLAAGLANGQTDAIRVQNDGILLAGFTVDDQGPLGFVTSNFSGAPEPGLDGDQFGDLASGIIGDDDDPADRNNEFEGVYIDDLIIGFGSRGTLVTNSPANTNVSGGGTIPGGYQLEIRSSTEFTIDSARFIDGIDINDRLSNVQSLEVPSGDNIVDGQTFQIGALTFEFENEVGGGGVADGNVAIPYGIDFSGAEVAASVVSVINQRSIREQLNASASSSPTGNVVNFFGSTDLLPITNFITENTSRPNDIPQFADFSGFDFGETGSIRAVSQLESALDVDLVRVNLLAGERIWVDLDTPAAVSELDPFPLPADTLLEIWTADEVVLAMNDNSPARDENGVRDPDTTDSYLEFTAPANGEYFVAISTLGPFGGEYTLNLTVGGGSPFIQSFNTTGEQFGDSNQERKQGQLLISSNRISNSEEFGIDIGPGDRDNDGAPAPGAPRFTSQIAEVALVPGVTITNNVVFGNEAGGIRFAGDVNPDDQSAASVPFGRIVNNTLYGTGTGDTGIRVEDNAGPTLLNNIVANFGNAITVDNTSADNTIIGGTLFKDNGITPDLSQGDFNIDLDQPGISNDVLFVDAVNGNFYLAEGSLAIDSSIDSLQERPELLSVADPLGISPSPILAPQTDVFGLLRVDDPDVEPPSGLGQNVFVDRGAIDRADNDGPTVALSQPLDNDGTLDNNPAETIVERDDPSLPSFIIDLIDSGAGIDDNSVDAGDFIVSRNGTTLTQGIDYRFVYDQTNNRVILTPQAGVWLLGDYQILVDNSSITDLAANPMQPNQLTGVTTFTISIGDGLDFGDAPDPIYPTLQSSDGARHPVEIGFFLGSTADEEVDALASDTGDGDGDDGIRFDNFLVPGETGEITVTATSLGFLDAWIDFNGDGDWNDAGEQIFARQVVLAGDTSLDFQVTDDAIVGPTYARFRYSSNGGLAPTGLAIDGEVEDYRVVLFDTAPGPFDFGDAPAQYPTSFEEGGAYHVDISSRFLGNAVDLERVAQTSPDADGDGADDDGVTFEGRLRRTASTEVTVQAFGSGFLNAWIDFNADGDWDEANEQIFNSQPLDAGINTLSFTVPEDSTIGETFARFRFSSTPDLEPTGEAPDGEVEDYRVSISTFAGWHNSALPTDVNDDGATSPLDALQIINELNAPTVSDSMTGALPVTSTPPPFFDVNFDNFVSPLDAVIVINQLNELNDTPQAALSSVFEVTEEQAAQDLALRSLQSAWQVDDQWNLDEEDDDDESVDNFFAGL